MSRVRRILAVTAGLMLTGAIAGGLAAAVGLALAAVIRQDLAILLETRIWGWSALIGAGVGGILAPLTGWLFLRHVPLGKLVVNTTIATALLGGLGFALELNPVLAAGIGFFGESLRLAIRTPRKKARPRLSSDDSPPMLEP